MRPVRLLAAPLAAAALSTMVQCSSKQGTSVGGGVVGTPQNQADGAVIAYPSANIGIAQRGLDTSGKPNGTRGSVIANYKFLGYPNADKSKGLQTISLADFYDPTGKKAKLLHIIDATEWCGPCTTETLALLTDLGTPATDFRAQGVVYLQTLSEGNTVNVGATQADLNDWIGKVHPTFAEALDPEASELGVFFNAAEVPFNAVIDLRSMEVLQAGTGYEDPAAVKVWIGWVNSNPPSYASQ